MMRAFLVSLLAAWLWAGLPFAEAAKSKSVTGVLNLNQATAAQLEMLPGVGSKTAQAILAFRQKTKFTRPEDLVQVKGFGKKKFEKLKAHLTVTGASTLSEGGPAPQARSAPPRR